MDAQEGSAKFKAADALFRQGRYPDALRLLAELDSAYPNTKNVLLPMALCLERIGPLDQAERLCDRIIRQFQDPNAQQIKARISAARTPASPPSPGVGSGMPNLDANLLDGFLDPMPARKPLPPVSTSTIPRYVLIGAAALVAVAAVAALGIVGSRQGWFTRERDTVESVEAKLLDFWAKMDSCSAYLDMTANAPAGPKPVAMHGTATIDYLDKGGKPLFRMEGSYSVSSGPMKMDVPFVFAFDGADMYIQMSMMGSPTVMKTSAPAAVGFDADAGRQLVSVLHQAFDVRLLPEELLDGRPAYVLQLSPKAGAPVSAPVPGMQFGSIKVHIEKGTLSQIKAAVSDATGAPVQTVALKNIRANPMLTPERFAYTPPYGVKVVEVDSVSKMMPMAPPM